MARLKISELWELRKETLSIKDESEKILGRINAASSKYEAAIAEIDSNLEESKGNVEEIAESRGQSETLLEEIRAFRKGAEDSFAKVAGLAERVDSLTQTIEKEDERLKQLAKDAILIRKTVEGLLPGATSAGLASAFKERKESFQKPAKNWSNVFIGSIIALLVIAFVNPVSLRVEEITADNFYLYVLMRLPFLVPVVWLAIYAAHRHNQALRLEEEYAHKEAISKSFEGYKTQLLEIESDTNSSAAEHLVNRTLEALGRHPGRIYDAKREDLSPLSSAADAAKSIFSFKRESSGGDESGGKA